MSSVNNTADTTNNAADSQTSANNGGQQKTTATGDSAGAKPPDIEEALRNALMLGWSIVELRSRIQIAAYKDDGPADSSDYTLRRASVWRALFSRIAGLQSEAFPNGTTDGTLYEPPSCQQLPYLYPPAPDYADVGIIGKDINGGQILKQFKLFDVTRRAINCLSLLYVNKEDSLAPETIEGFQQRLIKAILEAASKSEAAGGDQSQQGSAAQPPTNTQTAGQAAPDDKDMQAAREVLTKLTVKFLRAWGAYLRETYYVGGSIPKDDLELVAFEAGHSLSSLSWNVSVETTRINREARDQASQHEGSSSNPGTPPDDITAVWKALFTEKVVISIQHQISALSTALDNAYYQKHPELKPTKDQQTGNDDGDIVVPNPDLPSQAIEAVKHGLDYWQRAVFWQQDDTIKRREGAGTGNHSWEEEKRVALIEQGNIWQTLLTGQQSLRAYNIETATREIMQDVTEDIQKSLRTDFKSGLHQAEAAMKEMAEEVKEAISEVGKTAANGLEELFKASVRFLWPVLAVMAVLFIVLAVIAFIQHDPNGGGQSAAAASGGVGISGILSAIIGYFGLGSLTSKKEEQQTLVKNGKDAAKDKVDSKTAAGAAGTSAANAANDSLLTRIEGAAEGAGATILKAIERGYEQIRVELEGLNHSVGVAYPLVECFLRNFQLKGDADFLTKVIWDKTEREEELKRVMRAAFGPLALLIDPGGSVSEQPETTNKTQAADAS